jgi:hypothetical protein
MLYGIVTISSTNLRWRLWGQPHGRAEGSATALWKCGLMMNLSSSFLSLLCVVDVVCMRPEFVQLIRGYLVRPATPVRGRH